MLAYCGLQCDNCPIFLASRETDESKKHWMREAISNAFFEQYDINMPPDEVSDCDGCNTITGNVFPGCYKCSVRACARKRKFESCAQCPDFSCEKLEKLFLLEPSAKMRLEKIRNIC